MKIITGDILGIQEGMIAHQVNCKGVFNKGLAQQIREKYPIAYQLYMEKHNKTGWQLGNTQIIRVDKDKRLYICSVAGQDNYGYGKCFTDYFALERGLTMVDQEAQKNGDTIYLPYGIGCGLAGGDWEIVSMIIDKAVPSAIVVKLPT